MKKLLHLKTMLVTLLTMLVAMNASAQTQDYYSEGFENWTSDLGPTHYGWKNDGNSQVLRANGKVNNGNYALQIGTGTGEVSSNIVTPFLGKDGSIPYNVVMTLWFYIDNTKGTITLSAEGGAAISSITPSNPNKVTCDLNEGTAVVSITDKKYYKLTINLTNCNTDTKLRIKTTYRTYIDDLLVTGEASSDWKYNPESVNVTYGDNFTAPVLNTNGYNGAITYTSSNTSVATVNESGEVSILAVGETTITASGEDAQNPAASEASFTLTVNDIQSSATGGTGASLFHETFDKTKGTGGSSEGEEGSWRGNIATNNIKTDEEGWSFYSDKNGAYKCIRQGASGNNKKGFAMTRYIDVEIGKTYTLTFKAAPWDGESTKMAITVTDGCEISGINEDPMTPYYWNSYTATITPQTVDKIKIKFAATQNRFFLDEINVAAPSTSETVNVTIPSSGWGTFCYKYPLDFTAASSPEGLKAYAVSSTSSSNATLTQITEKIIGGTGIIINGTPGATYAIKVADNGTAYSGTNLLTGTLAPTYIEEGQYFLKSGKFVYSSAGTLPANKAYLKSDGTGTQGAKLSFVFDTTSIEQVKMETSDAWYDLSGRKVNPSANVKGVYIHNGKKVVK